MLGDWVVARGETAAELIADVRSIEGNAGTLFLIVGTFRTRPRRGRPELSSIVQDRRLGRP